MDFSFSENKASVARLKAYGIYDVTFKGIEYKSGTSTAGRTWQAFELTFEGDEGVFTPRIFCPGEDGMTRKTGETNGKKWELPSAMESLIKQIAHVCGNLSPEKYQKVIGRLSFNLPGDFEKLVTALKKILEPAVGKTIKLKTLADSNGYADIPRVKLNRDGEAFVPAWLGKNLSFSAYEMQQKKKLEETKPTVMYDTPEISVDSKSDDDDLDFEI